MTVTDIINEIELKIENKEYQQIKELVKILREYINDIRYESDYKIPIHIKNKL
jgi:hypothetical protein